MHGSGSTGEVTAELPRAICWTMKENGQRRGRLGLLSQICLPDSLELVSVTCSPRILNGPHLAVVPLHSQRREALVTQCLL